MTGTAPIPSGEPRVTLLTRTACHLCGPVRAVVEKVCSDQGESWRELSVDDDDELLGEYGQQVPVVLVDGEFVASFRLEPATLEDALNRPV